MSNIDIASVLVSDPAVRKYTNRIVGQIDNSLAHLASAQTPFADLLDRLNEMGMPYEDSDGEAIANLVDEASVKLSETRALLLRLVGADQ